MTTGRVRIAVHREAVGVSISHEDLGAEALLTPGEARSLIDELTKALKRLEARPVSDLPTDGGIFE